VTEILISQNEIPSEIRRLNKLRPNRYIPEVGDSKNSKSIANTDKNRDRTPNNCI
jgi:hypothetical protein